MKRLILFAFLFPSILTFSQSDSPKTVIEETLSQSGTLVKKEFNRLPIINGAYSIKLQITALKITSYTSNTIVSGAKFESGKSSTFLDKEELTGLISALNKMKEFSTTPVPENYTEYVFVSKSGLSVSIYSNDKEGWVFSITVSKYGTDGFVFFDKGKSVEAINKVTEAITEAKKLL